ncbi:hypothetical protein GYMLUDRAFT_34129 [Collybiopsis luxurians FD-317 M1]|nr:hypothetical protein GYMLUDRAFT_34129 [Collybiopsis luxurians FD-317 M1]
MSSSSVPSPHTQPLPTKLQTKNTLLLNSRTANSSISPLLSSGELVKRSRTISTSSVDTIRIASAKKKKRSRASEPSSSNGSDQNLLDNQRRTRQRKTSTDTIRGEAASSVIAFPTFSSSSPLTKEAGPINGKRKEIERKVTPPKLNPGHAAPSVAVSSVSRVASSPLEVSPPTAIRHAPPPPLITHTVRSRVQSMKKPAYHSLGSLYHRSTGFEPLPADLQDWQPSSDPYVLSDDEGSTYDGGAPSSPGAVWRDQFDNLHPGISDLDLSISFHKKSAPYFDVWDLPDDIHIAVPATLHIALTNPNEWKEIPSEPDLRYIDIKASTFDYRPLSEYFPPEYTVSYTGASSNEYADPSIIPADLTRGIIVNKKWHTTYPGSRIHFKESLITNHGRLSDDSIETHDEEDEDSISKRGWYFKFMIPIPSWVLRQGNTRTFVVQASAWIGGLDDGGLVRGETELVISHLRSEREMVKSRTQCRDI